MWINHPQLHIPLLILWGGVQLISVLVCSALCCSVLLLYYKNVCCVGVMTSQKLVAYYYICVYIMYQGVEAFDPS